VGQSCGSQVTAQIFGKRKNFTWGCDSWVDDKMQGRGIGKMLQGKLHEDCENFSSAWYSRTNGHIKRKFGGKPIFSYPFTYYPVSCLFSIAFILGVKKFISRKFNGFKLRLPNMYYYLNRMFALGLGKYTVREVSFDKSREDVAEFMETNLKDTDFHVIRSSEYLQWKYGDGGIKYVMLEVLKEGKREAIVSFRYPRKAIYLQVKCLNANILDAVIDKKSSLTMKDLLLFVMRYCKPLHIDGIIFLQNASFYPKLTYPYPCSYVLSTLKLDKTIVNPYLNCLDQEMEQV
jgi:hypothetical protein